MSVLPDAAEFFAAERLRWREKKFQAEVVRQAKDLRWRVYHSYFSDRSEAGFPDLVLVRERVVYAELKTMNGRLTDRQRDWIAALRDAGAEAYVWRPCCWNADDILRTLSSRPLERACADHLEFA